MKEIWKPVKGFENYEISNFGKIRNSDKQILSPQLTSKRLSADYVAQEKNLFCTQISSGKFLR